MTFVKIAKKFYDDRFLVTTFFNLKNNKFKSRQLSYGQDNILIVV